jgi:hypothetical protein
LEKEEEEEEEGGGGLTRFASIFFFRPLFFLLLLTGRGSLRPAGYKNNKPIQVHQILSCFQVIAGSTTALSHGVGSTGFSIQEKKKKKKKT